jgi:hypothetical protein
MNEAYFSTLLDALRSGGYLADFVRRWRDLLLLNLSDTHVLVIACDSNAAIGLKENDYVKNAWHEVGRSAAKVPLMEVLAAGAFPFVVINNLGVELEPTGKEILEGIRFEIKRLGLDPDVVLTGSAETNMPTKQTSVGMTVIGVAEKENLSIGTSQPGDLIACIGLPKSSPERPYAEGDPDITDPITVKRLRNLTYIHEVLPVGSKGIAYEMSVLAQENNLKLMDLQSHIETHVSAGAATCVLATLQAFDFERLCKDMSEPVTKVGLLN